MNGEGTSKAETVRFDSLDAMPPAAPLSPAFRALSEAEAASRAAADPDAIPLGFWETLPPIAPPSAKAS